MGIMSIIDKTFRGYVDEEENKKILDKVLEDFARIEKKRDKSILDKLEPEQKEEVVKMFLDFHNKLNLARQFIEKFPLYYDKANLWWVWNNKRKCWELTDEIDILNMLVKISDHITVTKTSEKNEILNALKQVARENKPKDVKNTWIQFNDEIVDLETGERNSATKEYFVTNPIPYNLGKSDSTPNMDRIFTEWVGKDHVKTLYQILAYCLLRDYPLHRIFCFIGAGMNGKSCYLRLLKKFIGNENVCSTELDTLMTSRFEVTKLHKKLVCQMGETNFNEMSKTSILKKLTGQDTIGFEYKNKTPFDDINYAKIIISTNNLPTTTDKTIGFYRRWLIIDFPNQFSEQKDILADIPEEEYENLGVKCIEILYQLLQIKAFHNEGSVEERMKKYEDHSDPMEKFIKEYTEEEANGHIWKFEFEKRLNEWCKDNRHRAMSEVAIGKKMKEKGIIQNQLMSDWLIEGSHKQLRAWIGIKWKEFTQDTQDKQAIHTQFPM